MSFPGRGDEARSLATIQAALEAGVTFIDTANVYHLPGEQPGHNERLVAKALRQAGVSYDEVLVGTKGGRYRRPDGEFASEGRPEQIRAACLASLKALGTDQIGLYQFHRPDVSVPYAESVGAFAELLDEGLVAMVGVSNADETQVQIANEVLGGRLVSVQNKFNPGAREDQPVMNLCTQMGVAYLPYSPVAKANAGEFDNTGAFAEIAHAHGVSVYQVALAWELALSPIVIPIPGASRPASIIDSAQAADLFLPQDELNYLNQG
jgi:aryl-alcohol dehydrogenase-like predicted oxidoreductase